MVTRTLEGFTMKICTDHTSGSPDLEGILPKIVISGVHELSQLEED
jgi:hypothetical protein